MLLSLLAALLPVAARPPRPRRSRSPSSPRPTPTASSTPGTTSPASPRRAASPRPRPSSRRCGARRPHTLLVDCGDTIQGSPLESVHQAAVRAGKTDSPDPMMLAMNAMGYDAMVVGNHEFNFGLDEPRRRAEGRALPLALGEHRRRRARRRSRRTSSRPSAA